MGSRFLIASLLALTALSLLTLRARADGPGPNSGPNPGMAKARYLVQSPKPEESTPDSGPPEDDEVPEAIVETGKHHSAAIGGGVIVCGLVAAVFVTVFWYIRVTRRRAAPEILA